VALVTASTGGIGFAIARGLAESGAEVIVNGRSMESVNKGITAAQQVQVRAAIADLSTAEGVESLLKVANNVDILVNNAGIYGPAGFLCHRR
jgi:short-subunit dehydrogenase